MYLARVCSLPETQDAQRQWRVAMEETRTLGRQLDNLTARNDYYTAKVASLQAQVTQASKLRDISKRRIQALSNSAADLCKDRRDLQACVEKLRQQVTLYYMLLSRVLLTFCD